MGCIKCGRDIEEGQVFCQECLEVMKKYPVKPGIAIQLPQRKEGSVFKKPQAWRRPTVTPEEQLLRLKKRFRKLLLLWLITAMLLAVSGYFTFRYFHGSTFLLPGQNYSTISDVETSGS